MDDVATWLSRLGLIKYADVFAKNDIAPDILPRLTEAHLKELGVSLGDRLRLLEAIEALQAEAHARSKQFDSGLRLVREALTIVEETQQYSWKAELKRIEGELLNASSDGRAESEGCFREALSIARQQNARSWELRTANALFQFWKEQERQSEAINLLHSVHDWFTEGFDTPDIRTAKILLG